MRRHHPAHHPGPHRPGKTLVMFALLLPLLLGMVGLSIDSGLLLATYRQAQNAADAAALAAAYDLYNGKTAAVAKATGATYVQGASYNNMSRRDKGDHQHRPLHRTHGPEFYGGNTTYAEAIVSYPYKTSFIQFLGVSKTQTVTARAVAGGPLSAPVEGVLTLQQNPGGGKSLSVSGGATLKVEGPVVVNGTDAHQALDVSGGSTISATKVSVSGGVTDAIAQLRLRITTPPGGGNADPANRMYRGQLRRSAREPGGADDVQRGDQHQLWYSERVDAFIRSGLVSPQTVTVPTPA